MSDLSPGKWMYRADLDRPINKLAAMAKTDTTTTFRRFERKIRS